MIRTALFFGHYHLLGGQAVTDVGCMCIIHRERGTKIYEKKRFSFLLSLFSSRQSSYGKAFGPLAGILLWLALSSFVKDRPNDDPLPNYSRCLVPIQVALGDGQRTFGTGFLVRKFGLTDTMLFLVTARHVIWNYARNQPATGFSLALVDTAGKSSWKDYPLQSDSLHQYLFLHPDSTVDAAVVRLHVNAKQLANRFLDAAEILRGNYLKKLLNVAKPGTDYAFYVGYQMDSLLQNHLHPLTGRGPLPVWVPPQPAGTRADTSLVTRLKLAKGNSGSPVFLMLNQPRFQLPNGKPAIVLAGLVSSVLPHKSLRNGRPYSDAEAYTFKLTRLVPASRLAEIFPP